MTDRNNGMYWQDRLEKRLERNSNLTASQAEKEIAQIYKVQAKELQAAILEVFAKMDMDKDSDTGIMLNDLYRNQRYWELMKFVNEQLKALGEQQLEITEAALIETYEMTQQLTDESLPKRLVEPSFLVPSAIDAKQVVHQVWCMDGKEFSDRIWQDKKLLINRLNKSLSDCLVQGKSPWEISQKLAAELQTSDANAYRILRTEGKHLRNKGKIDKFTEMGYTHGIFRGKDCCDKCKENDGKIYTLKELESMIPVHPHCRCTFRVDVNRRSF